MCYKLLDDAFHCYSTWSMDLGIHISIVRIIMNFHLKRADFKFIFICLDFVS